MTASEPRFRSSGNAVLMLPRSHCPQSDGANLNLREARWAVAINDAVVFLEKARASLAGAQSEHSYGRYNNAANRCYFACFQAAVAALIQAGVRPSARSGVWGHEFVQAQFAGILVERRKLYASRISDVLPALAERRHRADYRTDEVSSAGIERALRRATSFVATIEGKVGAAR